MTNKEHAERWAKYIIPAVFRAEDALRKEHPEWNERLALLGTPDGENPHKVAEEYCREIAAIIIKSGSDYEPDGTLENEDNTN